MSSDVDRGVNQHRAIARWASGPHRAGLGGVLALVLLTGAGVSVSQARISPLPLNVRPASDGNPAAVSDASAANCHPEGGTICVVFDGMSSWQETCELCGANEHGSVSWHLEWTSTIPGYGGVPPDFSPSSSASGTGAYDDGCTTGYMLLSDNPPNLDGFDTDDNKALTIEVPDATMESGGDGSGFPSIVTTNLCGPAPDAEFPQGELEITVPDRPGTWTKPVSGTGTFGPVSTGTVTSSGTITVVQGCPEEASDVEPSVVADPMAAPDKRRCPAKTKPKPPPHKPVSEKQIFSPGDPAERAQLIKYYEDLDTQAVTRCAEEQILDDWADLSDWTFSGFGLNPLPGKASTPISGFHCLTKPGLEYAERSLVNIHHALEIAKRDPPSPRFTSIALPAATPVTSPVTCTKLGVKGAAAAVAECDVLVTRETIAGEQLDREVELADSIASTIDNHSGAVKAGDQHAASLQNEVYEAELAELAQVIELANQANTTLAQALRQHLQVTLRAPFVRDPVAFVTALTRRVSGHRRAVANALLQLLRLYSPALSTDYATDLARPFAPGALADARLLTPADDVQLAQQLAAQGQLASAALQLTVSDLHALQGATGSTRTGVLSQLATTLADVRSPAAGMLEGAIGLPISAL
jgi:hypothetical protein